MPRVTPAAVVEIKPDLKVRKSNREKHRAELQEFLRAKRGNGKVRQDKQSGFLLHFVS